MSAPLTEDDGGGLAVKNFRRVVQIAVTFPDEQIVVSLIRQLSWTHWDGLGFGRRNLQQNRSFFLTTPIRQTVSGESSPAPVQSRRLDEQAQRFWAMHGLDQLLHQLTYAGMIYFAMLALGTA